MRPSIAALVCLLVLAPGLAGAATGGLGPHDAALQEEDGDGEETPEPTATPTPTPAPAPTETETGESTEGTETEAETETGDSTEATETEAESGESTETESAEAAETPEPTETESDAEPTESAAETDGEENETLVDDSDDGGATESADERPDDEREEAESTEDAAPASGSPVDGLGVDPSPTEAGAAVGAGAVATGLLARRFAGTGGTGTGLANGVSSMAATAPSPGRVGSEALARTRMVLSDGWYRFLGLAGYTKWAGDEPLEHETREALYDHLQTDPGTYLSAFEEVDAVDASFGSIRYHLDILEREGLVTAEKHQGKKRYYPVGKRPDALALAMEKESTRAIIEALAADPDSVSSLADRLGKDPSTVSHHLSRLEEDGLVERERDGQSVTNRLTPGVRAMLEGGSGPSTAPATGD